MLAILTNQVEDQIMNRIPEIFDLTFSHRLDMIDRKFSKDYPDHRNSSSIWNKCLFSWYVEFFELIDLIVRVL